LADRLASGARLGLKPMHMTANLAILSGLSLQEEPILFNIFSISPGRTYFI
jgi:hypothetical protein